MFSVPLVVPNDSYELWYKPAQRSHILQRKIKPKTRFLPFFRGSNDEDDSVPDPEALASSALTPDEIQYICEMDAIRNFGFTFLKPPGFTKTAQAASEEELMHDSESEDNAFIENPNGELVSLDGEDNDEAEEDEDGEGESGREDGEEEELDEEEYDEVSAGSFRRLVKTAAASTNEIEFLRSR
ncbi:uncharacterized protein V1516DRAFT_677250 [Lipomyces oligophaga]|uniref:uncharacterized protein n=1 Tax=Lipomyces oligophaga TaxID=45792 RepID=UPI0034CE4803